MFEFFRLASDEIIGGLGEVWLAALCGSPGLLLAHRARIRMAVDAAGARRERRRCRLESSRLGRLTGKIRHGQPRPETSRLNDPKNVEAGPPVDDEYLFDVVDTLDEVAKETGKTIPQVALNWVLQRPTVSTVIIGARNEEQLRQNLGAVGWNLTPDQVATLDSASRRTPIYPYWHQKGFPERNPFPTA
jgi:hypothetical protein